ncbi:hypothetical protein Tco_1023031, partial [Tanacetum coccineum]
KEEKDAEFVAIEEVVEEQSLKFPTVEQLLDEATIYDSEETVDIHEGSDSNLQSMPDDDLRAVSGFHTADSGDTHENEVSKSDHIFQDDNASTEHLSLPDHMDHICEEVNSLHLKLWDMESSIVQQVLAEFKSSLLALDSIKSSVSKSISEELPHFNAFNKLESQRFVLLWKELRKSLYKNMKKSIRLKVRKGMKEVRDKFSCCTSTVATNSQHVQDLTVMFKDMVSLLEAAEVFKKANVKGKKANIANIIQGEQPSAQVVLNKEKSLVVHNPEEKKSEGIVSIEDDLDDDDLDKQPL